MTRQGSSGQKPRELYGLESAEVDFDSAGPSTATLRFIYEGQVKKLFDQGLDKIVFFLDHFGHTLTLTVERASVEFSPTSERQVLELHLVNEWSRLDQMMIWNPFSESAAPSPRLFHFSDGWTMGDFVREILLREAVSWKDWVKPHVPSGAPAPSFRYRFMWESIGDFLRKAAAVGCAVHFGSYLGSDQAEMPIRVGVSGFDTGSGAIGLRSSDLSGWEHSWDYSEFYNAATWFIESEYTPYTGYSASSARNVWTTRIKLVDTGEAGVTPRNSQVQAYLRNNFPKVEGLDVRLSSAAGVEFAADGATPRQYGVGSVFRADLPGVSGEFCVRSVRVSWGGAKYEVEPRLVSSESVNSQRRDYLEKLGRSVADLGRRARVKF